MATWLKRATGSYQPPSSRGAAGDVVARVIDGIRADGDAAVRRFSTEFDKWAPASFRLEPHEIERIVATVPAEVLEDIRFGQEQVRRFAQAQFDSLSEFEIETMPGVRLGQRLIPIEAVGAYVPGGRFPLLSSATMTIVTAKVAGVKRVAAFTPPKNGEIPATSIATMHLAGADEIYVLGGAQAVVACAVGTESIPKVDMLAGPGNAIVAEAKRQLFGEVGIDLFAGPTEILVVADDSVDALTVAADLLGQAEHGPDSPCVLITDSRELAEETLRLIDVLLPDLPTNYNAEPAWREFGEVVVVDSLDEAWVLADGYASEHVEILTREPRVALERMSNYGALFLGAGTCVPFGDKAIGTNHVLPTLRAARYTGGLWVGKYIKTVTYQEVTNAESSALIGAVTARISRIEGFEGHARSADVRVAPTSELPWAPQHDSG